MVLISAKTNSLRTEELLEALLVGGKDDAPPNWCTNSYQVIESYMKDRQFNEAYAASIFALNVEPRSQKLLLTRALLHFLNNEYTDALRVLSTVFRSASVYSREWLEASNLRDRVVLVNTLRWESVQDCKARRYRDAMDHLKNALIAIGCSPHECYGEPISGIVRGDLNIAMSLYMAGKRVSGS